MTRQRLMEVYRTLYRHFGPRGWWPGDSPFEVCIGAILVQNTAWTNAARAIANLKRNNLLSAHGLRRVKEARLARLIRPVGYFNVKAQRVKAFIGSLWENHRGSLERMFDLPTDRLRSDLLGIGGIGPETADSILLYAAGRPVFVVDAYTHRIFSRVGLYDGPLAGRKGYDALQTLITGHLPREAALFNEYHALLVELGKTYCRPRPICGECPLRQSCRYADETAGGKEIVGTTSAIAGQRNS